MSTDYTISTEPLNVEEVISKLKPYGIEVYWNEKDKRDPYKFSLKLNNNHLWCYVINNQITSFTRWGNNNVVEILECIVREFKPRIYDEHGQLVTLINLKLQSIGHNLLNEYVKDKNGGFQLSNETQKEMTRLYKLRDKTIEEQKRRPTEDRGMLVI